MVRWAAGTATTALLTVLWFVGLSAAADVAPQVAGPPDGSHLVEVLEGSATGGNIFNLDGTHLGANNDSLTFFFVLTPFADSSQGLIVVRDPPVFDDGKPAVGIELFQDQRQGCGATSETTTNITGNVSGLATDGVSVGCLQFHDPTHPATLFFYVVIGDTIADFSFVIEPDAVRGVGSIEFQDGVGSLHPPDGPSLEIPSDLDGNGVPDIFQWVTGFDLDIGPPEPAGVTPYPVIGLSGEMEGDTLLITLDLENPFDPEPDVFAAGLGFRLDVGDGTSLLGGANFIDGMLFTGVTCLPDPDACPPVDVEATQSADKTRMTFSFVLPPAVSLDPANAHMSASGFFQETADSPSLFQQFPEEGSIPFVVPDEEPTDGATQEDVTGGVEPGETAQQEQAPAVEEEPEPEPEAEEVPTPEPISEPVDGGGVPGVAIGVGSGVLAVIIATAFALYRRKGKCDELRVKSDWAQAGWEAAVAAKGEAENAYVEAMASGDQAAISAAHAARQQAFGAEDEAYKEYQRAWNAYQDCVADQRDAAHAPPPGTEAPTTVPADSSTPGVIAGTSAGATGTAPRPVPPPVSTTSKSDDGCKGEWRLDKSGPTRAVLGKTVHMKVSPSTQTFRVWLDAHGTLLEGSVDEETEWEPASGEFDINHLAQFEGRKAQPLFRTGHRAYQVEFSITIDRSEQYPTCLRYWDCDEDGNLVPTDRVKLGDRQQVATEQTTFTYSETAKNRVEIATKLSRAYQLVVEAQKGERELEAWETQNCF